MLKVEKFTIPVMTTFALVKPLKDNKLFPGGVTRINDVHSSLSVIPTGRSDALVLIDTGEKKDADGISRFLQRNGSDFSKIVASLITHAHADHVGGANFLVSESNPTMFISEPDSKVLNGQRISQGPIPHLFDAMSHKNHAAALSVKPEIIKDDQVIEIDDLLIRCLAMPGHTDGSMGYIVSNKIVGYNLFFPGDALDFSITGQKTKNAYRLMTENTKQSRLSIIQARDRIKDLGIVIDRVIPSHSGDADFELLMNFK